MTWHNITYITYITYMLAYIQENTIHTIGYNTMQYDIRQWPKTSRLDQKKQKKQKKQNWKKNCLNYISMLNIWFAFVFFVFLVKSRCFWSRSLFSINYGPLVALQIKCCFPWTFKQWPKASKLDKNNKKMKEKMQ